VPTLTLPILSAGLLVDVRVNLRAPALSARQTAGVPIPASVTGRAILDTGSDVSGISSAVVQQLGLVSTTSTQTQGVGGPVSVDLHRVSLTVWNATQPHLPPLVVPDLLVMEMAHVPFEALIGMDVLLECRLLLDGPVRTFTLEY